jgi:hypothetical protein
MYPVHPYIVQSLAAERTRDMRNRATATRRARLARRGHLDGPVRAAAIRGGRRLVHRPV